MKTLFKNVPAGSIIRFNGCEVVKLNEEAVCFLKDTDGNAIDYTKDHNARYAYSTEEHIGGQPVEILVGRPKPSADPARAKVLPAARKNTFAWSGRCDCRNNHSSSSGRCSVRDVTDPTRTDADNFAACARCRAECPCGNGPVRRLATELSWEDDAEEQIPEPGLADEPEAKRPLWNPT